MSSSNVLHALNIIAVDLVIFTVVFVAIPAIYRRHKRNQ